MKASPLMVAWHTNDKEVATPVYSVHFDPHGKGRLATGGHDNKIRLWRVTSDDDERSVEYLSTLIKVGSLDVHV